MTLRQLTLADAEFIAHRLVVELMNYEDEPMPPFDTRSPGVLESCLAEPFQTFDAKPLHRTFVRKAAVLFYLVTKNHGFENGNKRMAVALTGAFFFLNKRWIDVSPMALYEIACEVAKSDPKDKADWQRSLEIFFKQHTVPLPKQS